MASIHKDIPLAASADDAWDAVRDFGALHTRLVPGFVLDTKLEGEARIVSFANGRSRASCWSIATTRGAGWFTP